MFEVKKAQNCFNSKYAFMYKPGGKIGDDIIAWLETLCPTFTCRRDLPKPFFKGTMEDTTQVQGVIGDVAFKVTFPNASPEASQASFEEKLEAHLKAAQANAVCSAGSASETAAASGAEAGAETVTPETPR